MKKLVALVLAVLLCASLVAGCGSKPAEQSKPADQPKPTEAASNPVKAPEAGKKHKFGFTCMTMNNPFFITIEASIRKEVEARGDILITMDTQQDLAKQIAQIEDMITQGVELVFMCPVDSKGIKPALDMLKAKKIPVVNFDTDVFDKDLVNTILVSNNTYAGQVVGEAVAKKFPNGGKIAILDAPYAQACVYRVEGFLAGLGSAKDKFKIVAQQNGKGDIAESLPIAENILQANPDISAFFCINDPSALGVLAALEAAKKVGKVAVYGVDGAPEAKASIKDGKLEGTGAQSPINIGKESVNAAYKIIKGEKVDKEIKVPTFLIDKSNIDQYGVKGWQ